MSAMDGLSRRAAIDAQKRAHEENGKQLEKLDIVSDAFKKAGIPMPELDRIRRALRTAHEAVEELFKDDTAKQIEKK